jgi:hypothetical protein
MGVYNNPRHQAPAVRRGGNALGSVGSPRANAMGEPGKRADGSAARTGAIRQDGPGRSPVRPTALATVGSAGSNGLGDFKPAKSKQANAPCHRPGSTPSAGGSPNRSAGVTRAKAYPKSEGF